MHNGIGCSSHFAQHVHTLNKLSPVQGVTVLAPQYEDVISLILTQVITQVIRIPAAITRKRWFFIEFFPDGTIPAKIHVNAAVNVDVV